MKVYFNICGKWVLLNNDTDFINGYAVKDFADKLSSLENDKGYNYKLDNFVAKIQYNQIKYCTSFSNLLFENIEI